MTRPHLRKFSAGQYAVERMANGRSYSVTITRRDDLKGWIAAAEWDRYLYTDAVPTLRAAEINAVSMINGAIGSAE